MSDERDPILDACLEEILGGQAPPDMTPRIMQAWSMLPPALPAAPPAPPPVQMPAPVQVSTAPKSSRTARWGTRRRNRYAGSVVAIASLLVIGVGVGIFLRDAPSPDAPLDSVAGNVPPPISPPPELPSPGTPPQEEIVEHPRTSPLRGRTPEIITPRFDPQRLFATDDERRPFELAINSGARVAAVDDARVVTEIDVAVRTAWQANKISPTAPASDDEFANRLYQRVLGREPTAAEAQTFAASRAEGKRAELVDALLTREENIVEFARYWSHIWTDSLVGRAESTVSADASREGLEQYLRRALQQAKPWDQVAMELLTATGSGAIGSKQYNGAANFLLAHHDAKSTRATAQIARAFLGKRIQCAQCHDHPNDSTLAQDRFWEMNTFLRQVSVTRGSGPDAPAVLASQDFYGDGRGDGAEAEVFYETTNGEIKVAYPELPGVTGVPRSGIVADFDRRAGLARYVAGSRDFRRVMVNRVWSQIFGFGFTSPVDDLGPHNPPSHPELLDALADQFAAHDHDLRALIRWMVLSEPFQLGAGPADDLADAPEHGRGRWFSRSYPAIVAPSAPRDSLLAMAKTMANDRNDLGVGTTANVKPGITAPGRAAAPGMATLPPGSRSSKTGPLTIAAPTVGQAGNFIPETIARILDGTMSAEQKLEHLFLVALQRPPTKRERALAQEIAGDFGRADREAWLRIWWALDGSRD